jgi:hypothetical protein
MPPGMERWVAGYKSLSAANTEFAIVVAGREKTGEWWEVPLTGAEIQELFPATAPVPAATSEIIKKRIRIRKTKEQG